MIEDFDNFSEKENKEVFPPELRLECYTFNVRKKRAKRDDLDYYVDFDNLIEREIVDNSTGETLVRRLDFVEFFKAFMESFDKKFVVYKRSGKAISIKSETIKFNSNERIISGIIEGGTTNIGGFVKDQTDTKQEFVLTPNHVSGQPYFFILYMPENKNTGLLIFQSYSIGSFSDIFRRQLQFFIAQDNEYFLKFDTYIPEEVVENFKKNGKIEKVSIYKQSISPDRGGSIFAKEYKPEKKFNIELKITGTEALEEISEKFMSYITNNAQSTSFFSMEDLEPIGFDDEAEVKFTFEHGGKTNTITSRNDFKFSPNFYIERGSVSRDLNYLPILEEIETYCKEIMLSLRNKMKL